MADQAPANTLTYATGTDRAPILLVPMPRPLVQRWLPEGIELMEPPLMGGGGTTHPVLLLYSFMEDVGVWPIPRLLLNLSYLELGVGVPWTTVTGDGNLGYTGPAFFTGLFYVEDGTALFLGNVAGSLPKYRAILAGDETSFEVKTDRNENRLARLDWTPKAASSDATRAAIIDAMYQPLVTRKPARYGGDITWYGMLWNLEGAPMHDIRCEGTLAKASLHQELAGPEEAVALDGAADPTAGYAVEARFSWHLNGPITDGAQLPLYRP